MGKPKGKRPFGKPRHRWENGIRMDCLGGVEWIQLDKNRDWWQALVNMVMNLLVMAPQS
jgi:hypothetical protein